MRRLVFLCVLFNCVSLVAATTGEGECAAGAAAAGAALAVAVAVTKKRKQCEPKFLHPLTAEEREEYDTNTRARNDSQRERNAAGRARVETTVKKGALVSLESAIVTYNDFCAGKGIPLPADDPRQIEFWESQKCYNSYKKIRVVVNGEITESSPVCKMKTQGTTKALNAERKVEKAQKTSDANMFHDQLNALEGCAIHLFLALLKEHCPEELKEWTFKPVFDGLQADVMAHHTSFPEGMYVPIQFKGAQTKFGKQTNYSLTKGQYEDWMYCIAIGVRDYLYNHYPLGYDDTYVDGARIYEIWDLGSC